MPNDGGIEALRERIGGVRSMATRNEASIKSFGERLGELGERVAVLETTSRELVGAVRDIEKSGNPNGNSRYFTYEKAFDVLLKFTLLLAGGLGIWKLICI